MYIASQISCVTNMEESHQCDAITIPDIKEPA